MNKRQDTMPNFLVVGAPRSGTTALYEGLRQHPEVYMSPFKEPWFFALEGETRPFNGPADSQGIRSLEAYRDLFKKVRQEKAVGEASTIYLHSPEASLRIKRHLPGARLVAILRNPVDRAYSNYLQHVQEGREPLTDFAAALEVEEERARLGWSPFWRYKQMGFYGEQLQRYLHTFDRKRLKIFLYEDLKNGSADVYKHLFNFLEVDATFRVDTVVRHNLSGSPRSRWLYDFLARPNPVKKILKPLFPAKVRQNLNAGLLTDLKNKTLTKSPPIRPELREQLKGVYREDILRLQDLLDRDLSGWLR